MTSSRPRAEAPVDEQTLRVVAPSVTTSAHESEVLLDRVAQSGTPEGHDVVPLCPDDAQSGPAAEPTRGSTTHLARLVLGLQIDALLLALGAATHDTAERVPWRRWLLEDLDVARTVARAVTAMEGAEPRTPRTQAGAVGPVGADEALVHLVSRYEAAVKHLAEVQRTTSPGPMWRVQLAEAAERLQQRLTEVRWHLADAAVRSSRDGARADDRLASVHVLPRPRSVKAPSRHFQTPAAASAAGYLPGELLG